jgi:chromosome partitioning protein
MVQNQSTSSLAIAQETWNIFPDNLVLEASIPRDDLFLLASTHGVPIGLLSRRPPAVAMVFDRIAVELEPRIGLETDLADEDPISLLE